MISRKFLGLALLVVLALRVLYLLWFGDDAGWMNGCYLTDARAFTLGYADNLDAPPLTPALLFLARAAGLTPNGAVAAVYLLGHFALTAGIFGLAAFVWPDASPRRRLALLVAIALVPLLSSVSGYWNLGVLLGTGLMTAALAVGLAQAARVRPSAALLGGAFALAALAAACRFESFAGVGATAVVLWVLGKRLAGVHQPASAGAALLVGSVAGLAVVFAWRAAVAEPGDPGGYGFYTFYDGIPFLMLPDVPDDISEYGRYLASMEYFGTFAENGGSVVAALLSNPGAAVLRFVGKAPDLFGSLLWIESLTPIGVVAAIFGARRLPRRDGAQVARGWVLIGFAAPLLLVLVPTALPYYQISIAPPLLLAIARALERWSVPLSMRALSVTAGVGLAVGGVLIALLGRTEISNSPVLNQAGRYLEARCREGCLANFIPRSLTAQTWADLGAGAPLPRRVSRSEDAVLGRNQGAYRRAFRWRERVERARATGYAGPVLYIEPRIRSFRAMSEVFDRETFHEGSVDLSRARLEKRFRHGSDELLIWSFSPAFPAAGARATAARAGRGVDTPRSSP